MSISLSGHNMTEGDATGVSLRADLFMGQEVKKGIRKDFKEAGRKVYRPKRNPHICLAWNPKVIEVTDTGYRPFHLSGDAEHWDIASPARGLAYGRGFVIAKPSVKIAWCTWWAINSWGKDNAEGPFRKRIMLERSLPVVRKFINDMHKQNRTIFMEADANNIRWDGNLPGMKQVWDSGLDRAWITELGSYRYAPYSATRGPVTGVGPDMKHQSLNWTAQRG